MQYGEIAGVGKKVSRLVQGTTMTRRMTAAESEDAVFRLFDDVRGLGCTAFDTAEVYGNEDVVGRWVNSRGIRDDVVVITHAQNRGTGAARTTGTRRARGEYVVMIDADGTYPPERFPQLCILPQHQQDAMPEQPCRQQPQKVESAGDDQPDQPPGVEVPLVLA